MASEARHSSATPTFAELLRRHRIAAALSQEALAERAGLSARAISDLERGVKTRPYLETVRMLCDALDLPQPDRAALAAAARPGGIQSPNERAVAEHQASVAAMPVPAHSLVGRAADIASISGQLTSRSVRLLTLTGIGGVGKTRLAIAVAATLESQFRDGVVWVELAPLTRDAFVAPAVAQAVGVESESGLRLMEALTSALRDSDRLLVLDNCEHLSGAVAEIAAELLSACPGVTLLATSRVRLMLSAEIVYPVAPLALTGDAQAHSNGPASDSATLFIQHARAARPGLTLDASSERDVDEICRRLEGLPLAIELAAARVRALSIPSLKTLLDDRLRLLTGGSEDRPERHRTLTAALEWSYDLLDAQERAAFGRLAVCAGGCSFEAAGAVMDTPDVFDTLGSLETLFDQSLIRATPDVGGDLRYTMLETVREFALVRLGEQGDESATRDRHAQYFLNQAETAESEIAGPNQGTWLRRMDADRDNVRGALVWFEASNQPSEMLRLGSALWPYWSRRGSILEGQDWLQRAVALGEAEPTVQARAFQRLGNLAIDLGDYSVAREMYSASLSAARSTGIHGDIAGALNGLGIIASDSGDYVLARKLYEESHEIRHALGDVAGEARCLYNLGHVAVAQREFDDARRLVEQALIIKRSLGDIAGEAYSIWLLGHIELDEGNLDVALEQLTQAEAILSDLGDELGAGIALIDIGRLAFLQGDFNKAITPIVRALDIWSSHGDRLGVARCLEHLAQPLVGLHHAQEAASLLGAADSLRKSLGTPTSIAEATAISASVEYVVDRIGRDGFTAAFALGSSLPSDAAIQRAHDAATEALGPTSDD